LRPEFGITVLDADPYFATGNGVRHGSALRFSPGQTVTFGTHGAATVSCSFWMRYNETGTVNALPPLPTERPSASLDNGFFESPQRVTLLSATTGATILYTLDGTVPTTNSSVYTEPITISTNSVLQAIAVRPDMANSPVLLRSYTFIDGGGGTGNGGSGCNTVGFGFTLATISYLVMALFRRKSV